MFRSLIIIHTMEVEFNEPYAAEDIAFAFARVPW